MLNREAIHHRESPFVDTVSDRMKNWPDANALHVIGGDRYDIYFSSGVAIAIAVLLYGGLHLLAWNAPFASRVEQVSWRLSGTYIAGSGILYLSISIPFKTSK